MIGRYSLIATLISSYLLISCYDNSHFVQQLQDYVPIDSTSVSFEEIYNGEIYTRDHWKYTISLNLYRYKGEEWTYGILQDTVTLNQSQWLFNRRGIGFGYHIEKMRNSLGENGGVVFYKLNVDGLESRSDGLPKDDGSAIVYCDETNRIYLFQWRIYKVLCCE